MKRVFYSLAIVTLAVTFVSCSQDEDNNFPQGDQSLETRASTLGYTDGDTYKNTVLNQCAAGNHENCDILADGTHRVCTNAQHSGTKQNGTHHNGTGHSGSNTHDPATCTDTSHNHGTTNNGGNTDNNGQTHDPATCTDATHNHNNGGQTHDPATCTDASHNHNGQNHDAANCKDKSHNHGTGNNGNNSNHH